MEETQSLDFSKLSTGKKILIGVMVVIGIAFVGYMNYFQNSSNQEQARETYQAYTEKATAIVSSVEPVEVNGTIRSNRFKTYITFTTADGEEITTTLWGRDVFVASEGTTMEILYDPTRPNRVITVEEYIESTGLTP